MADNLTLCQDCKHMILTVVDKQKNNLCAAYVTIDYVSGGFKEDRECQTVRNDVNLCGPLAFGFEPKS